MSSAFPPLRQIPISEVAHLQPPKLRIRTDEDVALWRRTTGYSDLGLFLRRLNESVVGHFLPYITSTTTPATASILSLFDIFDRWIEEIPPLPTPQRFGNLAFRTWGKKLEDNVDEILSSLLPSEIAVAIPHIAPYLLTSFGSFTRMDYGTGHETSFAMFLLCLLLIRFFEPEPKQERELVLLVFVRYLQVCWRLQDVYRLEPAGSHGVWGLDDYSFLGYIFGSAQLRDSDIPVSAILKFPLPPTNLYFLSISRIHQVKTGPFHEHSSQLYSIATGVPRWAKVNSGLFKMYEAEVLGKRVVVQHLPLGGLVTWDVSQLDSTEGNQPTNSQTQIQTTQAPWATSIPSASARRSLAPSSTSADLPPVSVTGAPWARHTDLSATQPSVTHSQGPLSYVTSRGPIVPPFMPLGPSANTSLRPMPHSRDHGNSETQTRLERTMALSPSPSHDSSTRSTSE